MFNNIGGKIKNLASTIYWIQLILYIIAGMIVGLSGGNVISVILGLLIIGIGYIVSWLSSYLLYGFGQLIENSDKLVELNTKNKN